MSPPSRLARAVGWPLGVLAVLALLTLAGCLATPRRVDLARLAPPDRVEIYEGGRAVAEHAVIPGSPEAAAIARWLQTHDDGWRTNYNTYAPSRRIQGKNFNLNFAGPTCVLNYDPTGRGDWVQVSRTVDDPETLAALFPPDR